ncbi:tetratricopeptide repeat protein [Trinickia sp. LjRoot230]|uniref:tetratricopeptide repeat protein n=1 Tax=Trinickia sp. LjRoot230 TaxID=3342288 RepID=UPI003ECE5FF3
MKPPSGRSRRTAALAATAVYGFALAVLPCSATYAQTPRPTTDGTPQIDASIASRNWSAALSDLDTRIASNPRDAQAKFKRGTVLAHLHRDDDAIQQFVELTQIYPELPEPYNNLAALYAKHGRYEEARTALETAVKANPGYGLAYENLGDLYLRLSAEAYKRAQKIGQTSGATSQRLADIERIVAPRPATKASRRSGATDDAVRTLPPMSVPADAGATSPFVTPPYVAPSN